MKVLVNGGLNVSELDGWWDEGFSPEVGWTFGDRKEIIDDALHDREDAERLYDLLENEIIPLFYKRNERGIPVEWVQRMRQSMAGLTLQYSSVRSLQQYTENYYLPAAALYQKRLAHHGEEGSKIEEWKTFVSDHWKGIYYGNPFLEAKDGEYNISVPVFLNGMNQDEVSVELYANAINGNDPVKKKMLMNAKQENGTIVFSATVPADRPSYYYTPRIVPVNDAVSIPLECSRILWQH
jgi:starch phosphorylase